MERKKILSLTILAVSMTFLLIVLGIRGGIFQSSLVGNEQSGSGQLSVNLGSGQLLKEFGSDEERNLIYALLLNGNDQQGLYFPRVYKVQNNTRGTVAIALRSKDFISLEKKLSLQIKLPSKGLKYVGKEMITTDTYTASAKVDEYESMLRIDIDFLGNQPFLLAKNIDTLMLLPFEVVMENVSNTSELRLHIVNALQTSYTGVETSFPHFDLEGELHLTLSSSGSGATLSSLDKKSYTTELSTPKKTVFTAPGQNSALKAFPEIIPEKTAISPNVFPVGSTDPIYINVGVKDKDGLKDLEKVTIDLSPLGLAKENKLLEVSRTDAYVEYTTNFTLPNGVQPSTSPYLLTYRVYDKEGHMVSASFSLTVGKKQVEVDLNHDGIVDIKDMTLYINAYQKATEQ